MSKRSIPILIFLMALSLLGIIIIQYKWIDDAIKEKEQSIDNKVVLSIANVEQQLNDLRVFTGISDTMFNDVVLLSELEGVDTHFRYESLKKDSNVNVTVKVIRNVEEFSLSEETNTETEIEFIEDNSNFFRKAPEIIQIKSFVERMQMEIEGVSRDSDVRLDSSLVIRELEREFDANDLGEIKSWGIYDETEEAYHIFPRLNEQADYSIPLFTTDLLDPKRYRLELIVNKDKLIWTKVWTMILLSIVFLAIIFIVFLLSIRLILKHKKISQIKSDFINNMTHEFKTPLASISLAADSLMHPNLELTKKNVDTYSEIIKTEKAKLNKYVERILEVAMLEKGKLKIEIAETDLSAIISTTILDLELLIKTNNATVQFDLDEALFVLGNKQHLLQVFTNLIENSIKYSDKSPQISIRVIEEKEYVTVEVKDEGIGMSEVQLGNVFDRFYRVQTGNLHNTKGFGLGLSYSKMVIEEMGGLIQIASKLNNGTTVKIKLKKV